MDESKKTRPSRHGLYRLKARLMAQGLHAIDRRSGSARSVQAWRTGLVNQLGGPDNVTPAQKKLIEMASISALLVGHADTFLLQQKSVINKTKKRFIPLVLQRQQLVSGLSALLSQLGLERVSRPVSLIDADVREKILAMEEADNPEESPTMPQDEAQELADEQNPQIDVVDEKPNVQS